MALFRTGLYVKNHVVEQVQVASTPIASFNGNVTGLYIPEIIAEIAAKQSGSGDPSPDNIRPISGVSECNVTRCGKNVWSYGNVSGTRRKAITVDIKAGTYTISANVTSSDTDYDYNLILFYYEDNTTESVYIDRGTRQSVNVTLSKNVMSINFYASRGNNVSVGDTFSFTDIQLEVGSTATAYEAYNGNTYTIQLGDTYYGCLLNATTGVLTVTSKMYEFDGSSDENWVIHSSGAFQIIVSDSIVYTDNDSKSNMFVVKPNKTTSQLLDGEYKNVGNNFYFKYSTATTLEGWKTFIGNNNLQVLATLNTPFTVQLTPTQVEQLLGANNVWADTGDVEVKFYNVIR